jgi:predicted  nucleic acid-binding Zn-ribbon protein
MDQPGTNHYAVQMSQQAVNGRNGYYGQAGYDSNGYVANGHVANGHGAGGYGYTGSGEQAAVVYQAGAAEAGARTTPDTAATAAEAVLDGTAAKDAATRGQEGNAVQEIDLADGQATSDAAGSSAAAAAAAGCNSPAERMRELLARSTADHAAVERATATTLEEIRQRLAGLEHAVAEVREHAGSEQDSASRTAEQMSTQAQRLAGMSATLDGLTAGLSTFSAQLSTIDGRLANADSRLAGADVKLASTEGRVSALDTRFERLDERLDDQYDRVTSIDNRLAATDGRLSLLGTQFSEALKPLAEELRARPVRSDIEAVVTKVVEAVHGDISTRLTSLEDTVLTLAEALLRPAAGHTPPSQLQNGPGHSRRRSLLSAHRLSPQRLSPHRSRGAGAASSPGHLPGGRVCGRAQSLPYSHSIVPGGLLVTSTTTRLTSATSLVIRVEMRASTSCGSRAQSAVIASSLVTGRNTTG